MGRKKYEPTERDKGSVEAMSAFGVPEDMIAKEIGCSPHTLRKYFREELDKGRPRANMRVVQSLYNKATGDGPQAVTAAIFWCKTQLGWREPAMQIENSPNGAFKAEGTFKLEFVGLPAKISSSV
jgi:hypothetical protein